MSLAAIWAARAAIFALLFWAGPGMTTLGADWDAWLLALSLFMLAQVFRFLRLLVVAGRQGTDTRGLLQAHCLTASAGMFLILAIGAIYRLVEVAAVIRSTRSGVRIVWTELAFEGLALAMLGLWFAAVFGWGELAALPMAVAGGVSFAIAFVGWFAWLLWSWLNGTEAHEGWAGAKRWMLCAVTTALAAVADVMVVFTAPLPLMALVPPLEKPLAGIAVVLGGVGTSEAFGQMTTTGALLLLALPLFVAVLVSVARRSKSLPSPGGVSTLEG